MLAIAQRRVPRARIVRAAVPRLPFADRSFSRAFAANLYGHLLPQARSQLVSEMARVADELIILDQLSRDGTFHEGLEERELLDGSRIAIHKCYFTVDSLVAEIGGGEVLMEGPVFVIVRRSRLQAE